MTRKLRTLGLAPVAVFAMSALAASAAQAQYTLEGGGSATVSATASSTNQTFTAGFGSIKCKKVSGTGSFTSEATELTAENIAYSECSALAGILPATVDFPAGCHFLLTLKTGPPLVREVHLKCGTGESITITIFESGTKPPHPASALVCTFHITPQTFQVIYHNITSSNGKMAVEVTATEAPVATSHSGSLCGTGEETAHYTGNIQVVATKAENRMASQSRNPRDLG